VVQDHATGGVFLREHWRDEEQRVKGDEVNDIARERVKRARAA
jgi:hypothetical protein